MDELIERAVATYGGRDRWEAASAVEATFDASGLLFTLKRRPIQTGATVRVATTGQHVEMELGSDRVGVLDGPDVEIRDSDGQVIEQRKNARRGFRNVRHWVQWDDADFTYFGAAAWWTYLLGPMAWLRDDVETEVIDDSTVDATYDPSISTHCRKQRFHLDDDGRIVRHDYTAEVVSRFARADHHCSDHRDFDGITFATTRRVHPAGLPAPNLVALDIHDLKLIPDERERS